MNFYPSAPEYVGTHEKNNRSYSYDIEYVGLFSSSFSTARKSLDFLSRDTSVGYPDLEAIRDNPEPKLELGKLNNKLDKIKKIYRFIAELSLRFKGLMNNKSSEKIVFKQEYFDGVNYTFKVVVRIFHNHANEFFTDFIYTLEKSETIVYYSDWSFKDSKEYPNEYIIEKMTIRSFFKRSIYILNTLSDSEKNGEIGIIDKLHIIGEKIYDLCQKYLKYYNSNSLLSELSDKKTRQVKKEITIFMTNIKNFTDQFVIIETTTFQELEVLKKYIIKAYSIIRKIVIRQKERNSVKIFDIDFYLEDYNEYREVIKLVIKSSEHDKGVYFTELMYVVAQEGHKSKTGGLEDEKVNVETFFNRLNRVQTNMVNGKGISLNILEELKKIFIKIDDHFGKYLKDGIYYDALEVIRKFHHAHQKCMEMIDKKIKKKKHILSFISDCI